MFIFCYHGMTCYNIDFKTLWARECLPQNYLLHLNKILFLDVKWFTLNIFNSLILGKSGLIFKMQFSILFYWLVSSDLMLMPSEQGQKMLLMINQYSFR